MAVPTDLRDQLSAAAGAVTETLFSRGYRLDCVLGARLLTSLLAEIGIDCEAVGSVLSVADPRATATLLSEGTVLQVGGHAREMPGGFNGHVVVTATIGTDRYLVDPTIGQLYDNAVTRPLGENLLVLVTRLRVPWPSAERTIVELPIMGWTLIYEHAPDIDWTGHGGWNHPEHEALLREVREVFERGPDLDGVRRRAHHARRKPRPGRNEACPCGSGKKYKVCCGR